MTSRRGQATHVRPRPPSTGRPRQSVRVAAPSTQRVRQYRGIDSRRRGLPLSVRFLLLVALVALGVSVFLTASGGIGPLVASLGGTIDTAISKLIPSAEPSPTTVVAAGAPSITPPAQSATSSDSAQLEVLVPVDVVGTTASVRVYVALQGLTPTPVTEVPVGSTTLVEVPVHLTKGNNQFTATIVRDGVESAPSAPVTLVLDKDAPKITISSPKNGATVDTTRVTITGTTQAGSLVSASNATNGQTVKGQSDKAGKFSLSLPIDQGTNTITITVTDPAGNAASSSLTVKQGSGDMSASLSASLYQISVSKPPSSLQLRVKVTDSKGNPVVGATAFFTLQIPGLAPISSSVVTDLNGRAIFTTSLVGPMTRGTGLATVLVTYGAFGSTTDRVNLTFVK